MTSQEINASWVAEDPMNVSGQIKNIEFVGLYDDNMVLKDKLNIAMIMKVIRQVIMKLKILFYGI